MDDYTRKFSIVDDKDVEIYNILTLSLIHI